jgi:hypothetical protein
MAKSITKRWSAAVRDGRSTSTRRDVPSGARLAIRAGHHAGPAAADVERLSSPSLPPRVPSDVIEMLFGRGRTTSRRSPPPSRWRIADTAWSYASGNQQHRQPVRRAGARASGAAFRRLCGTRLFEPPGWTRSQSSTRRTFIGSSFWLLHASRLRPLRPFYLRDGVWRRAALPEGWVTTPERRRPGRRSTDYGALGWRRGPGSCSANGLRRAVHRSARTGLGIVRTRRTPLGEKGRASPGTARLAETFRADGARSSAR